MQTLDAMDELLGGFECSETAVVRDKINRFTKAGVDQLHLIFDFDRTMTVCMSKDDDVTTWHILQRHLPPEGQEAYQAFYQKYRQYEINSTMTPGDAQTWARSVLGLYVQHKVNLNKMEDDFLSTVALRPGTKELLQQCHACGVPTAILSAGIKDVIEILLKHYDVQADPVVSTQLITDSTGVITGWHDDTLIHMLNKHEADHPDLDQIRAARPHCILIGDSMNDASMAAGDANVLRIRVIDPRPGEALDTATQLDTTFQKFDLAITTETLDGVSRLVQAIAR